ncbi:tetratricopeptide repeat protein [Lysinibacillus macroides]|uniref:tetratricopeptide repeat protein n=1 Tax=Lysinibacillus macroides TaxID=33935 RepID=UPI0006B4D8CA|nr:J domain-containing protein [Lysinibacillus macroides]QPR67151.1 tetratricopeptide repeat protein [Lysinibacillus macroides]
MMKIDTKNYYTILNVSQEATEDEIKRAFYKLVRIYTNEQHHEEYQLIREAYNTLSNSEQRRAYDEQIIHEDINILLNEADRLLENEQTANAIVKIKQALAINPKHLNARKLLAQGYMRNGQFEQAIQVLKDLQSDIPNDVGILISLMDAYIELQRYKDAANYAEQALSLEPTNDFLVMDLARIYSIDNRIKDIFTLFKNHLKDPIVLRNLPIIIMMWDYAMYYNYENKVKQAEDKLQHLAIENRNDVIIGIIRHVEDHSEKWFGFRHAIQFVNNLNNYGNQDFAQWTSNMQQYVTDDIYYFGDIDYGDFAIKHGGKPSKNTPPKQVKTQETFSQQIPVKQEQHTYQSSPVSAQMREVAFRGSVFWAILFGIIFAVSTESIGLGVIVALVWYFLAGYIKNIFSFLIGCGCLLIIATLVIGVIINIFS